MNQPDREPLNASVADTVAGEEPRTPDLGAAVRAVEAGTVINGRYVITDLLGEGGMGAVYRATDLVHGERAVALKMIRGQLATAGEIGRFKAEFRHMTRLRHVNIAEVYDFERMAESDEHYFTMELIAGRNIYEFTHGAPWPTVVGLLVQVCRALAYVHSRRLIHFDIKPANVLVTASGDVKVLDFGIAAIRPTTALGSVRGTPHYMAPEIIAPDVVVDHRVDLFSLGVLAYQLLCRKLPFQGHTPIEVMTKVTPVEFSSVVADEVPVWLQAIVLRLCALQPAARFRTANAVIEEINARGALDYKLDTLETRESYIFSTRFVGRDAELEQVNTFVAERIRGRGKSHPVLLVGGQSGVGKSRLAREVRHQTQLSRFNFLEGDCVEAGAAEYAPIAQVLKYAVRLASGRGRKDLVATFAPELVKMEPGLAQVLQTAASPLLDQAERERQRLIGQVSEFLVRVAQIAPFVLYFNDLQWASAATCEWFAYLTRRITSGEERGERVPLALFGTFRDDEVGGTPFERMLAAMREQRAAEVVSLRQLPSDGVHDLLSSMLGVDELPQAFVERVVHETAGNPFFVEEVLRALVENGSVFLSEGMWAARDTISNIEIPGSVAATFVRRASMLDAVERRVLEVLAICHHSTTPAVVARSSGLEIDTVHSGVGGLLQRNMVVLDRTGSDLQYRVSHDRMRDAVYGQIPRVIAIELHGRVAEALEADEANREASAELIAYQFARSEQWQKAVTYGLAAAGRTQGLGRFVQTQDMLEQARSWMRQVPDGPSRRSLMIDVLEKQERVLEALGARETRQVIIDELLATAEQAGDRRVSARAHLRQGDLLTVRERFAEAFRALETALEISRHLGDTRGMHDALSSLGFLRWSEGRFEDALAYNEQVLESDRRSGDRSAILATLCNLAVVTLSVGDHAHALECIDETIELAKELDVPLRLISATHQKGNILRMSGDVEQAMEWFHRCEQMEESLGAIQYMPATFNTMASIHCQQGNVDEGLRFLDRLIRTTRESGLYFELGRALRTVADLLVATDRWEEALPYLSEAASLQARLEEHADEAAAWQQIALIHQRHPDREAPALEAWRKVRSLSGKTRSRTDELAALEGMAKLLRSRDAAQAALHYAEAAALAHEMGNRAKEADLLNTLAIVEWTRGGLAAALSHYERSFALFEELGDWANGGLLLNCVALTLLRLGRHAEAEVRLEQALAIHAESGQRLLAGQALAVLGDLHVELGRLEQAIPRFAESLAIRREIGDRRGEGWMLQRLAAAHARTGDAIASEQASEALTIATTLRDDELAGACRALLGSARS